MNMMALALNPNLSEKDIVEIVERKINGTCEVLDHLASNMEKLPDAESRNKYFNACIPAIITVMFF